MAAMPSPYQRILVIINPVSGTGNLEHIRKLIETRLREAGVAFEVRLTEGEGDALRWAQAAAADGFDLVLVSGGDGTVVETMTGLIKSGCNVPLAQLPAGTASLIARALHIPTGLEEALEVIFNGKTVRLDVGYLPEQDRYFALICGAGWDARLIEDAPRTLKRRLGFAAYVLTGIKQLFNLRKSNVTIEIDGQTRRVRAHTVMIVNIGRIDEANLRLGPDIWHHDGKLDVIVVAAATFGSILRLAWRLLSGRFSSYRDLTYLKAERVSVTSSPPLPVQVDGDPMGSTPLTAETVPDGALVLVPNAYEPRSGESGSGRH